MSKIKWGSALSIWWLSSNFFSCSITVLIYVALEPCFKFQQSHREEYFTLMFKYTTSIYICCRPRSGLFWSRKSKFHFKFFAKVCDIMHIMRHKIYYLGSRLKHSWIPPIIPLCSLLSTMSPVSLSFFCSLNCNLSSFFLEVWCQGCRVRYHLIIRKSTLRVYDLWSI